MNFFLSLVQAYFEVCLWLFGEDSEIIAYALFSLPIVFCIMGTFFVLTLESLFCNMQVALRKRKNRKRYQKKIQYQMIRRKAAAKVRQRLIEKNDLA